MTSKEKIVECRKLTPRDGENLAKLQSIRFRNGAPQITEETVCACEKLIADCNRNGAGIFLGVISKTNGLLAALEFRFDDFATWGFFLPRNSEPDEIHPTRKDAELLTGLSLLVRKARRELTPCSTKVYLPGNEFYSTLAANHLIKKYGFEISTVNDKQRLELTHPSAFYPLIEVPTK